MALQVGGAIGVAVVGSVLATRYQGHMGRALAGRRLPVDITHTVLSSFGGALAVAGRVGGASGALLARAARAAFMSGLEVSFLVGAGVSLAGVVAVLVWLPSRALPVPRDAARRTRNHARSPGTDRRQRGARRDP